MRRILLFDTIIDGHHADYLTHLIAYWLDYQPIGELIVVTQEAFEPVFRRLVVSEVGRSSVQFISVPPSAIDRIHRASMLQRSFREWNLLLDYVRLYQPTHVLLMYIDIFQAGLWLGRKAPCAVSGIYFRPDFHYLAPSGLKSRLNTFRKKLTLQGMIRHGGLKNIFCLDHSAVADLRRINPDVTVVPLPDPVQSYSILATEVDQLRTKLQIQPNRQVFLLFGHLDERKGIEPLLDALKQVNPALRSLICLLLVGAIKPNYRVQIERSIADVNPEIQIICVFEEVRGRLIQLYFDVANYALALYQRHVGMASVIIRAAVSGKPLLASDYGYIGQFVEQNQLGALVDSTSPAAIRQLLEKTLSQGIDYSAANLQKVAEQNSNTLFAETIISRL